MRKQDISARSPMPECLDQFPRQSLDARRSMEARRSLDVRRSRAAPRSSLQERRKDSTEVPAETEEAFEDVGLNDEPKPAKKKGLFARFGDNSESTQDDRPTSSGHHHFGFTGRKRAESGKGSELRSMPKPQGQATEVA